MQELMLKALEKFFQRKALRVVITISGDEDSHVGKDQVNFLELSLAPTQSLFMPTAISFPYLQMSPCHLSCQHLALDFILVFSTKKQQNIEIVGFRITRPGYSCSSATYCFMGLFQISFMSYKNPYFQLVVDRQWKKPHF